MMTGAGINSPRKTGGAPAWDAPVRTRGPYGDFGFRTGVLAFGAAFAAGLPLAAGVAFPAAFALGVGDDFAAGGALVPADFGTAGFALAAGVRFLETSQAWMSAITWSVPGSSRIQWALSGYSR